MNKEFLKNVLSTSVESQQKLQISTQKIKLIAEEIAERFDADGIDDINLPKKINFMFIFTNISAVIKLIRKIVDIIKQPVEIPAINADELFNQTKVAERMFVEYQTRLANGTATEQVISGVEPTTI